MVEPVETIVSIGSEESSVSLAVNAADVADVLADVQFWTFVVDFIVETLVLIASLFV